ncbi:MAG: hypothetical protein MJK10_06290 [Pseudomonadales bacterium]|nr:hypothetical protein [Pseudomonadales bacterium]NRA14097.1 hypothetical protein [Oceanospirillaceae bacterium]
MIHLPSDQNTRPAKAVVLKKLIFNPKKLLTCAAIAAVLLVSPISFNTSTGEFGYISVYAGDNDDDRDDDRGDDLNDDDDDGEQKGLHRGSGLGLNAEQNSKPQGVSAILPLVQPGLDSDDKDDRVELSDEQERAAIANGWQ